MKIFNGTPHPINIIGGEIEFKHDLRKFVTNSPVIEKSIAKNSTLSATIETNLVDGFVFEKKITGCDKLPEGFDIYVVSALYATAYQGIYGKNERLYTVADPVYSLDGKTIHGC
jgi:hypothetical protein